MKSGLTAALMLLFTLQAMAQDTVFQWKVSSRKLSGNQYELRFQTPGKAGWQLYAPNQTISEVSTTKIQFDSAIHFNNIIQDSGQVKTEQSALFGVPVKFYEGPTAWKLTITIEGKVPAVLQDTLLFTYGRGEEFYGGTPLPFSVQLEGGESSQSRIRIASIDLKNPVNPCGDDDTTGKSLWTIFLLGFLGGLIALVTPCVFPLIPLTVSFFTKKSGSRQKGRFCNGILGLGL